MANELKPIEALSDEELMEQMAQGDSSALGQVYLRYGDSVLQLLSRSQIGVSAADVDDICQDAFMTIFKTAPRYVHMGKLRSWIYKIALREAKAQSRKKWLRAKLFRRFVVENKVTSMGAVAMEGTNESAQKKVAAAIAGLTQGQREVITLAVQDGMSGKEIAETLGLQHNAVRAKLHRARQSIAASLQLDVAGAGEK